jgi:hypothetical protein
MQMPPPSMPMGPGAMPGGAPPAMPMVSPKKRRKGGKHVRAHKRVAKKKA